MVSRQPKIHFRICYFPSSIKKKKGKLYPKLVSFRKKNNKKQIYTQIFSKKLKLCLLRKLKDSSTYQRHVLTMFGNSIIIEVKNNICFVRRKTVIVVVEKEVYQSVS